MISYLKMREGFLGSWKEWENGLDFGLIVVEKRGRADLAVVEEERRRERAAAKVAIDGELKSMRVLSRFFVWFHNLVICDCVFLVWKDSFCGLVVTYNTSTTQQSNTCTTQVHIWWKNKKIQNFNNRIRPI